MRRRTRPRTSFAEACTIHLVWPASANNLRPAWGASLSASRLAMKPYRNSGGHSGVIAYDYGPNWIRLEFVGGRLYKYTASSIGASHLKTMKRLANAGRGLTTFVSTHPEVKNGYV